MGPQWRAGKELKATLATTPTMNTQIGKIQTKKNAVALRSMPDKIEKRMWWLTVSNMADKLSKMRTNEILKSIHTSYCSISTVSIGFLTI